MSASSTPAFIAAMRKPGPHICPDCGERVTAFAVGCSLCRAELVPRRAQGKSLGGDLRGAWLARARVLPRIPLRPRRRP